MHTMEQIVCCRTCLSESDLNPIFKLPNECKKYTDLLFNVTGLRIEMNDKLPQTMCSKCINFINKYLSFRRQCQTANSTLLKRLKIIKTDIYFNEKKSCENNSNNDNDFSDSNDMNLSKSDIKLINEISYIEFEMSIEEALKSHKNIQIKDLMPKKKVKLKYEEIDEDKKVSKETNKGPWECKYCYKVLNSKMSLNSHYKIHTARNIICEHCGKKFTARRPLLVHCRAKHGYERTDKCSYCNYRGSSAELVKIHERTHTGERPYVCATCGASFHRRSSYLQHRPIHLPHKTVPCPECPALFKSATLMRIHRSRHRRRAAPASVPVVPT